MTKMRVEDVEANLREILARVRAGETIEIEGDGEPLVQIRSCDPLAGIESVFFGVERSTMHMRDVKIHPMHLREGVDAVAMLIEDRADRDLLS